MTEMIDDAIREVAATVEDYSPAFPGGYLVLLSDSGETWTVTPHRPMQSREDAIQSARANLGIGWRRAMIVAIQPEERACGSS